MDPKNKNSWPAFDRHSPPTRKRGFNHPWRNASNPAAQQKATATHPANWDLCQLNPWLIVWKLTDLRIASTPNDPIDETGVALRMASISRHLEANTSSASSSKIAVSFFNFAGGKAASSTRAANG